MNGPSLAADDRGEIPAAMNQCDSADRVMTAAVPARVAVTLYALVGGAFATRLALLRPKRPGLL